MIHHVCSSCITEEEKKEKKEEETKRKSGNKSAKESNFMVSGFQGEMNDGSIWKG